MSDGLGLCSLDAESLTARYCAKLSGRFLVYRKGTGKIRAGKGCAFWHGTRGIYRVCGEVYIRTQTASVPFFFVSCRKGRQRVNPCFFWGLIISASSISATVYFTKAEHSLEDGTLRSDLWNCFFPVSDKPRQL